MANIQSLATELLETIAAQLNVKDNKSLRFVNKRLCSQVTPLVFSRVVVPNVPESDRKVEMLKCIADPESIGGHVAPWARTATFNVSYRRDECESDVRKLLPSALKKFTGVQILKLWMHPDNPDWMYDTIFSSLAELPHLTDLWIRARHRHQPHPVHPPLPFHLLESQKTLRCIRISTGDVRSRQYAEKLIIHPLRTFLRHSNIRDLTFSLGVLRSDVQLPSIYELLPPLGPSASQLESLGLEGFLTDMPMGLPPSLRGLKRLTIRPVSDQRSPWKDFQTNRLGLQELAVSCDGSPFDVDLMSYLSSYSGLEVLHLNFRHLYPKSSWPPESNKMRKDTVEAFYYKVVPQHKATLRVLTMSWPTQWWCLQPAHIDGIRSCENLEVLRVVVAQNDVDILVKLLELAASMPKLGLLYLSDHVPVGKDRDFRRLTQNVRRVKIRAPSSREVTPLYLQLRDPDWVFGLREVDDGWSFRLVPVPPRTIGSDSMQMINL